jgi:hypothetical protein
MQVKRECDTGCDAIWNAAAPATVTGEAFHRATGRCREGRNAVKAEALKSVSRETCQRKDV